MPIKTLYFLGTKEIGFDCLNFLIENRAKLGVEIKGVLSNNRSVFGDEKNCISLANKHQIQVIENLEALLQATDVDFIFSVQYHEILKKEHIAKARIMAVNYHMAPLPEYRGCNQFSFAIIDNCREFGTTAHVLEEGIDSGAILDEIRFEIPKDVFVKDLYDLTFEKTFELFKNSIKSILNQQITPKPQAHFYDKRSSGFHLRNEIEAIKRIDLSWPKEKQKRHFRATYFPPFNPPKGIDAGKEIDLDMNWYKQV